MSTRETFFFLLLTGFGRSILASCSYWLSELMWQTAVSAHHPTLFFLFPPNSSLGSPEDLENVQFAIPVNRNTAFAKFLNKGLYTQYSYTATQN